MVNSNSKGKRGERELSKELARLFGCDARRSQQYCGEAGDADVITSITGLHCEVKRVERLNLERALEQAESDARATDCPVVFHRRNGKPWNVSLRLDDLPGLITIITEFEKNENTN
tara:strand:+ start:78 stop:425 length:348 start_codon:yes stop_codon:yes gene_type:complete